MSQHVHMANAFLKDNLLTWKEVIKVAKLSSIQHNTDYYQTWSTEPWRDTKEGVRVDIDTFHWWVAK